MKHSSSHFITSQFASVRRWHNARSWWQKGMIWCAIFVLLFTTQAYGIAYWYQKKHAHEPLSIGVTYIKEYAEYYDLDPKETFLALRDDLGFTRFRLVSYWKSIETSPGVYDFSDLDWQFDRVNEIGGTVTLAIGLRQPRWPECHAPNWVQAEQRDTWYPELQTFMRAVVNRYKDNPALQSYQLENEYFLDAFGECSHFGNERERLIQEFNLVKSIDTNTPIIISYANNTFGLATGQPRADQMGVSVYKRVWDATYTKRYFEYPLPSWYYAWRAGWQEILTGKDAILHELQAEPWTPTHTKVSSIEEQNKSMDAIRLKERIDYGVATGFRTIDLWGGEWWYWRKVQFNDDSLWETVRQKRIEYNQSV